MVVTGQGAATVNGVDAVEEMMMDVWREQGEWRWRRHDGGYAFGKGSRGGDGVRAR